MKALKICKCGELMNRVDDSECNTDTGEKVCWKCPKCGRTKSSATEKELGCEYCEKEEPIKDDVNKDMSFIIRDGILYVLRDEYNGSIGPMCVTVASFKIKRCPMCGKKLGE